MNSETRNIPDAVADATTHCFTKGATAFIHRPQVEGFSLVGLVYQDWKDRFKNGRLIRTSIVRDFDHEHGYLIAVTLTGSRYVLIEPDHAIGSIPQLSH
jgi:hypothetical protein